METLTPESIQRAVRSLIAAERTSLGIEVSTPVAYPGGDLVNVVVESRANQLIVHDSSFAAARLTLAGVNMSRHVQSRLSEYAARFNCRFENQRVLADGDLRSIEIAIAMVANASRSVADYALELRRHVEIDFRNVVADCLREIVGKRLRENEEFAGRSGRKYRVSAIVLDEAERAPELFVAPISSRAAVPQVFAMLYDLKESYASVERESVYDGDSDVKSEDRALLKLAGDVLTLSEARHKFRMIMGDPAGSS
ncbi:MAG: hypothetical protein JWO64_1048 [Hyphomicrobiales bacterium]|nr:hypothetical protein [Hyphomicrobiales bacterium]